MKNSKRRAYWLEIQPGLRTLIEPPYTPEMGPCDQPGCQGLGVIGNENVVNGKLQCDYCSIEMGKSQK